MSGRAGSGDPLLFEQADAGRSESINASDGNAVWDRMMRTPGLQFGFQIKRDSFDPERSFSKEALTTLRDQIGLFIGTRIIRYRPGAKWNKQTPAPQKMQVTVIVSIDGERVPMTDAMPYLEWDDAGEGQHRQKGVVI